MGVVRPAGAAPRLAIIGGGGAMGRLFARLLAGAVRELYLFDYFGRGSRPASLNSLLSDLREAAGGAGRTSQLDLLVEIGPDADSPGSGSWRRFPASADRSIDSRPRRALGWLGAAAPVAGDEPPGCDRGPLPPLTGGASGLADGVAALAAARPQDCIVFAGQPEDAAALLPRADLTLLALGFEDAEAFTALLQFYRPWLRSGSLVVDLGSTKTGPMQALQTWLGPEIDALGAHPLFGPAVSDLTGLIVAVVEPSDGRRASPWRAWFVEQLARLRMIVTPTTAVGHDDAMAFVQSLTHFVLLAYAYTFVRLDRDPADLLALRTPVFEPLLYLAARVAHLAYRSPDTYRAIQTFSTRPEARTAFLAAARDLLAAIEASGRTDLADADRSTDPVLALFRRYGALWSPEGRDRRDRQRREHFLDMGVTLVDHLNRLRQATVAAIGEVRAVEDRRPGQPPRVVVGVVDLDLLDPGKQDVATRIRLRRINLPVGAELGAAGDAARADDPRDYAIVPLARARLLTDPELLAWLYQTDQLVERRMLELRVPDWFDGEILRRLVCTPAPAAAGASRVWEVALLPQSEPDAGGRRRALVQLVVVLHPGELVAARRELATQTHDPSVARLEQVNADLAAVRARLTAAGIAGSPELLRAKDELKHARKAAIDARTAALDRAVRRVARQRVDALVEGTRRWLLAHGCEEVGPSAVAGEPANFSNVILPEGKHDEAR